MESREHSRKPLEIAILDDNLPTLKLTKLTLERHTPCVVYACENSEELFARIGESLPDLLLLDIELGQEDGIDICRRLKSEAPTSELPVIFLSAFKEPAKRVEALQAGAVDYVNKPFYPEELVTRVTIHAEIHRLELENQARLSEQQALLHVLCHDLVNPIFAAHSLLSLGRDTGELSPAFLSSSIDSCQGALDIIANVKAEQSLVQADKQAEAASASVEAAFGEAANTIRERYETKGVELIVDCDADVRLKIKQVALAHNILVNLLTNALKFSFPNERVVLKSRLGESDGKRICAIEVRDTGIGMPTEILSKVFDDHAKVSRRGTDSEEGTGFGMPLVKRYVEKNGGAIGIESSESGPDRGTVVRIAFPVESE